MLYKNPNRILPIIEYIKEARMRRPNYTLIQLLDDLNIITPQFDYGNDQKILDVLGIPTTEYIKGR